MPRQDRVTPFGEIVAGRGRPSVVSTDALLGESNLIDPGHFRACAFLCRTGIAGAASREMAVPPSYLPVMADFE